jgi:parvulin-like peptidyl-prolyl isomerase
MAIFVLNKGQVSPPALTPVGLYIFMVTDVKPGPPTAFESVKADVYEDLINAQSTDWLAKLQKDAQIERAKL